MTIGVTATQTANASRSAPTETMMHCPGFHGKPRQCYPPSHRKCLICLEVLAKYTLLFLVFNDFFEDSPYPKGGLIPDCHAHFGNVGNPSGHVLEPLLIGLIIGNRDDLGGASGDPFH